MVSSARCSSHPDWTDPSANTIHLGDQDDTVGRTAVEWTGECIAAPYQFAALPGVGHYAADQVSEQVNALLLAHLARHPV